MFKDAILKYDEYLKKGNASSASTLEFHRQLRAFIGDMINKAWAKTSKPGQLQAAEDHSVDNGTLTASDEDVPVRRLSNRNRNRGSNRIANQN
jgi:hypothetical protein